MPLAPYLFFNGRCEEAIAFYQKALGAKVEMLMRNRESPEPHPSPTPEDFEDKIMHAALRVLGEELFLSDGDCVGEPNFQGFSISLTTADVPEAKRLFEALSEEGAPIMPFGETFFSPGFGMLRDKFGLGWMVMTDPAPAD